MRADHFLPQNGRYCSKIPSNGFLTTPNKAFSMTPNIYFSMTPNNSAVEVIDQQGKHASVFFVKYLGKAKSRISPTRKK